MSPTGFVFTDAFGSVDSMSFAIYFVGLGLGIRGLFPGCVAQAPVSLCMGGCGLKVCSPDVAQPSATIRVRAVWRCFWRVLQKRSLFGGFKHRIASFHVADMALCDMQTCFITCRKSLFVTCTILLRRFQIFSWQAQHFGDLHGHFAWQALHLDMTC